MMTMMMMTKKMMTMSKKMTTMTIPLYKAQACIPRPTLRVASCRHEPDVTLNTSVLVAIMMIRMIMMVMMVMLIMIMMTVLMNPFIGSA